MWQYVKTVEQIFKKLILTFLAHFKNFKSGLCLCNISSGEI